MPKPIVTFFHRKVRAVGNYSLEFIFEDVRKRLQSKIESKIVHAKHESTGLKNRLINIFQAAKAQNGVNHVTGDINFIGLLLHSKKTIHTILDCIHLKSSTGIKHKILKYFWHTIPLKRSAYITAISEATKQEILKYGNCNPDKIKVIPVAISERFIPAPKAFNFDCPTILQLGAAPNKNIESLIEALKNIPCKLVIIGAKQQHIVDLLKKNRINYEYLQNLSDEEVRQAYINADIVTLVSTYEGFGMPILEAQATGRVVITSNILSMPEVGGNAALYVNPYNVKDIEKGFQDIINNHSLRDSLIALGFENIKRFNAQSIAEQYLELYQLVWNNLNKNN